MLIFVVVTCRLHVLDVLEEMPIMASRGQIKSLIKCLH